MKRFIPPLASFALLLSLVSPPGFAQSSTNTRSPSSTTSNAASFDAASFARTFTHHTANVNGVRLHYVIGGKGDPVVLLHGWPETWYAWRKVMPALAERYTVIVPDLRGFGDSSKPMIGYDTRTIADDIYQLVRKLGFKQIFLVGHDISVPISYSYAAAHREDVRRLVVLEMLVPGSELEELRQGLWHFGFNKAPNIPETLITGREREYISFFYKRDSYNPTAIADEDIDEYTRAYSAPGALRGSLGFYREIDTSIQQSKEYAKQKLRMPVLAIGGDSSLRDMPLRSIQPVAQNVRGVVLKQCGHFVAEERPTELTQQLLNFFGEEK